MGCRRGPAVDAHGKVTDRGQQFRRGDTVAFRSAHAVLETLDDRGEVDGLPFMPEMLPLIGKTFTVSARADKTCDTIDLTGCSREMDNTVHVAELRCDGSAHGGCQAGCVFFVKESWLTPGGAAEIATGPDADGDVSALRERVLANTTTEPGTYRCQATALPEATRAMTGISHFVRDFTTRNVEPRIFLRGISIAFFDRYQRFSRRRLPHWARYKNGDEQPDVRGTLKRTPVEGLDLQPGEWVQVRSLPEIIATLNANQRNRNLWFDREMIRYCGRRFRVVRRVDRLLDEKTGKMIEPKTPSIILDGAVCVGDYHKLCPRRDYAFFREVWLERLPAPS